MHWKRQPEHLHSPNAPPAAQHFFRCWGQHVNFHVHTIIITSQPRWRALTFYLKILQEFPLALAQRQRYAEDVVIELDKVDTDEGKDDSSILLCIIAYQIHHSLWMPRKCSVGRELQRHSYPSNRYLHLLFLLLQCMGWHSNSFVHHFAVLFLFRTKQKMIWRSPKIRFTIYTNDICEQMMNITKSLIIKGTNTLFWAIGKFSADQADSTL